MKGFTQIISFFIGIVVAIVLLEAVLLPNIININETVCMHYNQTGYGQVCTINTTIGSEVMVLWGILPLVFVAVLLLLITRR